MIKTKTCEQNNAQETVNTAISAKCFAKVIKQKRTSDKVLDWTKFKFGFFWIAYQWKLHCIECISP